MKKIGFFGCADATTLTGEVTVEEFVGLETVNGKSSDPPGGGTCAGGAGKALELGDHVIGTGGVDGYVGGVVGGGGVGGGLGSFTCCLGLEPQLMNSAATATRRATEIRGRERGRATKAANNRMSQPSESERPMTRSGTRRIAGTQPKSEG